LNKTDRDLALILYLDFLLYNFYLLETSALIHGLACEKYQFIQINKLIKHKIKSNRQS